MQKSHYTLAIADWLVNSAADLRTELINLEINQWLNLSTDSCCLAVYAPPAPPPGLLEQAVDVAASALGFGGEKEDAFSVQVRGNAIKHGDALTVELTSGERTGKVLTAEVQAIESALGLTKITGITGKQKLSRTRLNQVYENQTLGQIVNNLAEQADVATGEIETGSTYSYFVVHETSNFLQQICALARRDGLDFYFDTDNRLTLKKFTKTAADHTFFYGIDLLDLQLRNQPATSERLMVYGESPASQQGAATWHWLVKDLSPFRSEAGEGARVLALHDGAVRTKDAADSLATAKLGALKDQATTGRLKLLGNPLVKLGDAIEIKNVPKRELNGLFKVTAVRHVLSKREGFVTYVSFSGQGGAAAAGGLLGAVARKLDGVLGL